MCFWLEATSFEIFDPVSYENSPEVDVVVAFLLTESISWNSNEKTDTTEFVIQNFIETDLSQLYQIFRV